MNILVIRVSAIGDVIHTIPAVILLKQHFPHACIHWVTQKKAAHLLRNQPFIDHLWELPDKFLKPMQWKKTIKVINGLRHQKWDAIIDFQGLLKTAIITLPLSGKKYGFAAGHTRERANAWFTHHHDAPNYTNIVQKNLSLASAVAQHLGGATSSPSIDILKQSLTITVPADNQNQVTAWLAANKTTNYMLLCPNTTWPSKHWPESNWVTLIELLKEKKPDIAPILVGTTFGKAANNISSKIQILTCPAWDLLTISHLIKQAQLVIAPDTGLLHLADFLGTSAIGIFGPTHKEKHGPFWTDINKKLTIQIACPHFYQKNHGAHGTPNCMAGLTPQQLIDQVSRYLEKQNGNHLQ